jgi:hypothetical protein
MSEIPEDIRKTAEDMIMPIIYSGNPSVGTAMIERALVEERERCARIAEKTHAPFTAIAIRKGDAG